jgi:HEAT repeat protein
VTRSSFLPLLLPGLLLPNLACATSSTPPPSSTVPGVATTATLENLRPKVLALLGSGASTPDQWKALGPEALTVLRQLASDPTQPPAQRASAVGGMAYVDNPLTSDVLKSFATDPNLLAPVRESAVLALAARDGTNAVPALAPLLADGEAEVRTGAARALGNAGGAAARTALQSRLDAETDPHVRDEIQKALTRTAN